MNWFFSSLLKNIFTRCRILDWWVLSFSARKMCCCFPACMVSNEKSVIQSFCLQWGVIFLWLFSRFVPLFLVLRSLIMMHLGVDVSWPTLFGIHSAPWISGLRLCPEVSSCSGCFSGPSAACASPLPRLRGREAARLRAAAGGPVRSGPAFSLSCSAGQFLLFS